MAHLWRHTNDRLHAVVVPQILAALQRVWHDIRDMQWLGKGESTFCKRGVQWKQGVVLYIIIVCRGKILDKRRYWKAL